MRRRVDFKFLGCLLAALAVCAGGVHLLHGYQMKRNARVLLVEADEAEGQHNLDRALQYLQTYLAHNPKNTPTFIRYALLLKKRARTATQEDQAFVALERALTRQPDCHEVRRELVPMAMQRNRLAEAQEHLNYLLEKVSPHDPKLEHLLAQCYVARKDYRHAAEKYQLAIADAPADVPLYTEYAALLRRQLARPEEADKVMDGMVAGNPKSFAAYLARGHYRQEHGKPEPGRKDVARAYDLAPGEPEVLQAMARLALDQKPKDFAKARAYLQHSLDLHPDNARTYLAMADLEGEANRRPEAVACLRRGLKKAPPDGRYELLWGLANLLAEADDGREEAVDSLRQAGFPPAQVKFVVARCLMSKGDWLGASGKLEEVRPELHRWPELVRQVDSFLGQCYAQLGDPDRQYVAYRRVAGTDLSDETAALGLASSLLAMGKTEEALDTYRALIPQKPELRLEVGRLLVAQNLRLPQAQRQWQEVDQLLDEAERAKADPVVLALLRADALAGKDRLPEARAALAAARDKRPKEVRLWVALASLEERGAKPEAGLAVLEQARRQLGDCTELRLALAGYWARRGGAPGRGALTRLTENLTNFPAADQDRIQRGVAEGFVLCGDSAAARRLWVQLDERHPRDLGVKAVLFDLALRAGDDKAMSAVIQDMRDKEGEDGTLWRYGRVCQLIWQANQRKASKEPLDEAQLAEAQVKLDAVARKRPAWSSVPVCAAQLELLKGNRPAAIRDYQRAVNELGNHSPEAIRQLVLLLYEYRRFAEAELVLRKLPEEVPLSPELARVAADISLQNRDYEHAVALAKQAVSQQSKDYHDYLWLGVVLARSPARQEEAERALQQAVALAGASADARPVLIQYLISRGQKDRAVAEIRKAERTLPPDQAPLALGPCYEALGEVDKARQLYQAALTARPGDVATLRTAATSDLHWGRWEQAEANLRKIVELSIKSPVDASWARRGLAIVLAARGDYQHSREALATLGILGEDGQPVAAGAGSPADQHARAVVLAAQRSRHHRLEAIRILEALLAQEPPTPDDQFLLAQLYNSVGDWPHARRQMVSLLSSDDARADHLVFFTQALLEHRELNEAEPRLEKLRKLPGADGTFAVTDLRSRLLVARDRAEEAVAVVREYVANKEARPEGETARRELGAALLDVLARDFKAPACAAAAEAMYRACAAEKPEARTALAAFLGRQGRLAEALRVCEQAWQTCPPPKVALVSVLALRDGEPDAQQYQLVEGWLESALARNPKSTQLLVCRGCLRDAQGYHDEAAGIYRQVLERDARNLVALNNLATLSALRGQGAEALALIDRALEKAGPQAELRDTHALANLASGQTVPAVEELEEIVLEQPQPTYCFHLAQAYLQSGKEREAREALKKAKARGLRPSQLHPLERATYDRLIAQLATK